MGIVFFILSLALYILFLLCTCCCHKHQVVPLNSNTERDDRDKKSFRRGLFAYGWLAIFTLFAIVVLQLGIILGAVHLGDFFDRVPDSVGGAANIVEGEVTPIHNLVEGLTADVMNPFLLELNHTVTSALDIPLVRADILSINDTIYLAPDADQLREDITAIEDLAMQTESKIDITAVHIREIESSLNDSLTTLYVVKNDLLVLDSISTNLSAVLDHNLPTVDIAQRYEQDLNGPGGRAAPDGYTKVLSDAISHLDTSEAWQSDNMQDLYDDLSDIISGSLEGDVNGISSLAYQLLFYSDEYAERDFNYSSQILIEMKQIDDAFTREHGIYDQTKVALKIIEEQLGRLNFSSVLINVNNVYAQVESLSFTDIKNDIQDIAMVVNKGNNSFLTRLTAVVTELEKINLLYDLLPLAENILNQTDTFNQTIYQLPEKVEDLYETIEDALLEIINTTMISTIGPITEIQDEISNYNFTEYLIDIYNVEMEIELLLAEFNLTAVYSQIDNFDNITADFNFTEYNIRLYETFSSLEVLNITDTQIEGFRILGESARNLTNSTARLSSDYLLLKNGYCTGDMTISCESDTTCSDISVGTCTRIGTFRCSDTEQNVDCTTDGDCTPPNYCLADQSRAATTQTYLSPYLSGISFETDELYAAVIGVRNASNGDIDETRSYFVDAQEALNELDVSEYLMDLQDIIDEVEDQNFNDVNETLTETKESLDDVDLSMYNESLDELKEYVDEAKDYADDAIFIVNGVVELLFAPHRLRAYTYRLSRPYLQFVAEQTVGPGRTPGGPGAVIRNISGTVQEMMDFIVDIAKRGYSDASGTKLSKYSNDFAEHMDRASGSDEFYYTHDHGALFYLLMLDDTTAKKMILPNDPTLDTILRDTNDDRYEDGKYCVTTQCFTNTREKFETEGLIPGAPFPSTYTMISLYLYIPSSIVCLIALLVLLCPMCSRKPNVQHGTATCLIVAIVLVVPLTLFLTGMLFPGLIFGADACNTGTNVASNFVVAWGDPLCTNQFGGESGSSADMCMFRKQNVSIPVNVVSMINGFLGSCDGGPDPFQQTADAVADQMEARLTKLINEKIDDLDEDQHVKKNLTDIAYRTGSNTAELLSNFLRDTGEHAINCANIESLLDELKEPFCTWFLGPMLWFIGCAYLAIWVIVCAVLPGACCIQRHTTKLERERRQRLLEEIPQEDIIHAIVDPNTLESPEQISGGTPGGNELENNVCFVVTTKNVVEGSDVPVSSVPRIEDGEVEMVPIEAKNEVSDNTIGIQKEQYVAPALPPSLTNLAPPPLHIRDVSEDVIKV